MVGHTYRQVDIRTNRHKDGHKDANGADIMTGIRPDIRTDNSIDLYYCPYINISNDIRTDIRSYIRTK